MSEANSAAELERVIERYNEAWNAQDLDAVVAFHAPGMVFENHTAGERAEGPDVRHHIGEVMYDLPCHQGHYTLATAPQITRALRRAEGDRVSLNDA